MAQAGVIRDFMVALGFKTDNSGLDKMQGAMQGIELKSVALKAALMSLATGAVIAVRQTASELDKLYFSSQRIGASATNITAFGNAISQMGGDAESAIGTLENLAEKLRNSPGYESQIKGLGVDTRKANGEMRDRVDVMKDLSGVLAKMPAYQANAYANSLGIDQNTLLAMRDGKFVSNMEKYQKIQQELGMNDELTKSGNDFMTEYRDLTMVTKTGFQVIVMQAGKALIPILRLLNQLVRAGISAFSQLNPEIKQMLGVGLRFAMLALVLSGFFKVFGMIFKFIPMLKSFIGLLKLFRLAFLASPIGIILALASALALLWDDYKTWKEGGRSLFDWSKWTNGIEKIIGKIKDFLAMLDKIKDKVINFVQKIISDPVAAVKEVAEATKEALANAGDEIANPAPDEHGNVTEPKNAIATGVDKAFSLADKGLAVLGNKDAQQRVDQRGRGEIGYKPQPKVETPKNSKDLAKFAENAEQPTVLGKLSNDVKGITQKGVEAIVGVTKFAQGVVKDSVSNSGQYSFSFGKDVDKYIKEASVKYGIDEKILRGFVKMEAGWTGKMSPTGAIGTGQFVQGTWNGLAKTDDGKEIGMTKITKSNFRKSNDPRHNKRINTLATGLLAKQNADILKKYGLSATGENLYLAHNIGAVTFAKALTGKGANADGLLAMRQNGMKKNETPKQFVERQKAIYQKHYKTANHIDTQPLSNIGKLKSGANIPSGNPHKAQMNNLSNMTSSHVTIHQEFKTDMTINGAKEPLESANAVKRQQENQMVIMARGAKGVFV